MRGYFAIGIYHPKTSTNMGTLWRSAYIFGASFIFTIGRRYQKQASDTVKAYRHIPLYNFLDFQDFHKFLPYDCQIVCVEIADNSIALHKFNHPERAIYLLGAEDEGIPKEILKNYQIIQIISDLPFCLNVAVAGSIVMHDRFIKEGQ